MLNMIEDRLMELEIQTAKIATSLEITTIIQEKLISKLDKIHDEHVMAKGWLFAITGLAGLTGMLSGFIKFTH